jgi:hypothetical protein
MARYFPGMTGSIPIPVQVRGSGIFMLNGGYKERFGIFLLLNTKKTGQDASHARESCQ